MRDIDEIYTKSGTPITVVLSRLAFTAYFIFAFSAAYLHAFPGSTDSSANIAWILYLLALYLIAEQLYRNFKKRQIDLTFAFPLLFAVYCLHLVSILLAGQERLPILNRAEHFASFVFICYVVWIFFVQYLPQKVWRKHQYYTALLVFSVTSALGVGNELVELVFDSLFNTKLIGPRLDTSFDLLMNSLGAGAFLAARLIIGFAEEKTQSSQHAPSSSS